MFNEPGVELFYPKKKRYRLLKLKIDGIGEYLVIFMMIVLIGWQLNGVTIYWFERSYENLSQLFF